LTEPLSSQYIKALTRATEWHAGQTKKGSGTPYISHLLAVSSLVMEDGGSEEEAIAGLLHDVIEDCGADYRERIQEEFGVKVLAIVEGCTDSDSVPKPPWLERKKTFLKSLKSASHEVCRVAAADKLHNVRSIVADYGEVGDAIWQRFRGKKKGTKWYYRKVSKLLDKKLESRNVKLLKQAVKLLKKL